MHPLSHWRISCLMWTDGHLKQNWFNVLPRSSSPFHIRKKLRSTEEMASVRFRQKGKLFGVPSLSPSPWRTREHIDLSPRQRSLHGTCKSPIRTEMDHPCQLEFEVEESPCFTVIFKIESYLVGTWSSTWFNYWLWFGCLSFKKTFGKHQCHRKKPRMYRPLYACPFWSQWRSTPFSTGKWYSYSSRRLRRSQAWSTNQEFSARQYHVPPTRCKSILDDHRIDLGKVLSNSI